MSFATVRQFLAHAADNFALQPFEDDRYNAALKAALDETDAWHERECPLKAPLVVWLILAGVLYRAQSLASILKIVLSQYRQHCPGLSLRAITPEAACKARTRLGYKPLAAVFRRLSEDVRGTVSFAGLRVWSVDGTFLSMPDTPENEKAFGRVQASRGRTAYPQLHLTSLVDTATREVRDVVICRSSKVDERADAVRLLAALGEGDLLLMDCGFSAAWLFKMCLRRKIHFLARVGNCWKPRIIKILADGSYLVTVSGDVPRRYRGLGPKAQVLTLRLIVYQVADEEPVRLLTSLLDPEEYPASELAKEYHARWESELTYDEQKVHLIPLQHGKQKTVFRSKSPDGVRQELYGMLIAYNQVRRLMAAAAKPAKIDPRHLSFVESLRLVELATVAHQRTRSARKQAALRRQLLVDIGETLNPRPRRNRWFPRVVKIKMSNYKCKKESDCGCYRHYADELQVCPADRLDDYTKAGGKRRRKHGRGKASPKVPVSPPESKCPQLASPAAP